MYISIAPKQWTHHHTHRLFHMSMASIGLTLVIGFTLGMYGSLQEVHADSDDTAVSVTIPDINPGPSTPVVTGPSITTSGPVTGGGTSPITPPPTNTQASMVTVLPNPAQGQYVSGVFNFVVPNPTFFGTTNIRSATILLQINASPLLDSTTTADQDGNWVWQTPVFMNNGSYSVTVYAEDPISSSIHALNQLYFTVHTSKIIPPQTTGPEPPSGTKPPVVVSPGGGYTTGKPIAGSGNQLGGNGNTIPQPVVTPPANPPEFVLGTRITMSIPNSSKKIQPGQEVIANIGIEQYGTQHPPRELLLEYIIEDSSGTAIADSYEMVSVAGTLDFTKSFYTYSQTPSGEYRIVVKAVVSNVLETASDTFTIQGRAVLPITATTAIDYTFIAQAFGGLILLFLIILYFEFSHILILSKKIKKVSEITMKEQYI